MLATFILNLYLYVSCFILAEDFQHEQSDVKLSNYIQSKDERTTFHQLISCDDVDDDVWIEVRNFLLKKLYEIDLDIVYRLGEGTAVPPDLRKH